MRPSLALLVVAGCGGASASGSMSISIHDDLVNPGTALAACQTGDVTGNLAIVGDLRESYHEMIVCGGLQLDFEGAMINVIANAALGRGGPSQLVYQGHGTFATSNGMMALRVVTNDGGALEFDPLDPQS